MTQNEKVLHHLETIGPITCKIAVEDYSIMALHSRIADLRKDGHKITSKYKHGVNRFGDECHWYEYSLEQA